LLVLFPYLVIFLYHYPDYIGRKITFYNLRKTYISHLYATQVTGHSGEEVMKAHYIDERVLSEVAQSFEIFKHKKKSSSKK
jgi:hypothetical protein